MAWLWIDIICQQEAYQLKIPVMDKVLCQLLPRVQGSQNSLAKIYLLGLKEERDRSWWLVNSYYSAYCSWELPCARSYAKSWRRANDSLCSALRAQQCHSEGAKAVFSAPLLADFTLTFVFSSVHLLPAHSYLPELIYGKGFRKRSDA